MKNARIALATAFLATLASGQTQSACPTCPNAATGRTLRWHVPIRTVPLQGGTFKLNLNGAGTASAWRVAATVKASSASAAKLQVAELEMEAPGSGKPSFPAALHGYGDREVSVAAGTAEVWMRPAAKEKQTVIYLELPKPMTLEVALDQQTVSRATIADSAYIVDGKLLSEKVTGFGSLLSKAAFRQAPQSGVQKLGPKEYFAPPAELAKHLLQFNRPPRYEGGAAAEGISISLLVTIGVDGEVKEVTGWRGDPRLVEHCRPAVLSWRFTPFLFNQSPVSVKASILIAIDREGNVIVPFLGSH